MFPNVTFEMQYAEEGGGYIGELTAEGGDVEVYMPNNIDVVAMNDRIWNEEWVDNLTQKGEQYER